MPNRQMSGKRWPQQPLHLSAKKKGSQKGKSRAAPEIKKMVEDEPEPWELEVRSRVERHLAARGWTSGDLSRAAGLPPGYVHEWLTGRRAHTRVTMLKKFAETLGISMNDLLGDDSDVPVKPIPVVGVVDSGSYRTDDPIIDRPTIWAPLWPGAHIDEHVAYEVADCTMDAAKTQGVTRGSVVICIKARRVPIAGDAIIIEYQRSDAKAILMRRVVQADGRNLLLVAESSKPEKYPPIEITDGSAGYTIIAFAYAVVSFLSNSQM